MASRVSQQPISGPTVPLGESPNRWELAHNDYLELNPHQVLTQMATQVSE